MTHERNPLVDMQVAPANVMETLCVPAQTCRKTAAVFILGDQRIARCAIYRACKISQGESTR